MIFSYLEMIALQKTGQSQTELTTDATYFLRPQMA
jgi:hypothetical protein